MSIDLFPNPCESCLSLIFFNTEHCGAWKLRCMGCQPFSGNPPPLRLLLYWVYWVKQRTRGSFNLTCISYRAVLQNSARKHLPITIMSAHADAEAVFAISKPAFVKKCGYYFWISILSVFVRLLSAIIIPYSRIGNGPILKAFQNIFDLFLIFWACFENIMQHRKYVESRKKKGMMNTQPQNIHNSGFYYMHTCGCGRLIPAYMYTPNHKLCMFHVYYSI
jgi:hypothetical protein